MIGRRQLRIKSLQALYTFIQTESKDLPTGEKILQTAIFEYQKSYIYILNLMDEVCNYSTNYADEKSTRLLAVNRTIESTKVNDGKYIVGIRLSEEYVKFTKAYGLQKQRFFSEELIRKLFMELKNLDTYQLFVTTTLQDLKFEKSVMFDLLEMIFSSEDVDSIMEEILPTWYSDKLEIAKTISRTLDKSPTTRLVFDIKTDSVEELSFCKDLFKYSVVDFAVNEKLIESKSLKWDLDRIALMDKLIIAQGIAEAEHFPEIPIKVTLNEYIEISKDYSTPQSKEFINGVLDNIIKEKMELGEVVKFGRGLKDN